MSDRLLSFKGSHKEIGEQIGEVYKKWGHTYSYMPPYAERYYRQQVKTYEKFFPNYLDYLTGIAKVFKTGKDKIYKISLTIFLSITAEITSNRCSVFAVKNKYGVFLGRNYDWRESSEKHAKLLKYQFTDNSSFNFLGISDMGTWKLGVVVPESDFVLITEDGWNEKGLYIGLNGAPEKKSGLGMSTPHVVQLIAEKCQTVNEALNILEKIPMASSQMFTLADQKGDLAVVEKSLEKGARVRQSKNFIIATNHYNHPQLVAQNQEIFARWPFHSTFARYHYLETNLLTGWQNIQLASIMPLMKKRPVLQNWRGVENGDAITVWILALDPKKGRYIVNFAPLQKTPIAETLLME